MKSLIGLQIFSKESTKKFLKLTEMLAKKQRLMGACMLS